MMSLTRYEQIEAEYIEAEERSLQEHLDAEAEAQYTEAEALAEVDEQERRYGA